jgi:hypothetical protein
MIFLISILNALLIATSNRAMAYPDFIGYGYAACLTCHVNGQGGTALNDYGRSLFAAEIAGRAFVAKNTSEDELADSSGFLGKKELPYWIRPAIKYRGLEQQSNVGSSSTNSKYYLMQLDFSTSFIFDKESNYLLHVNYGHLSPTEQTRLGQSEYAAKELFLRMQPVEGWWIYLGQLDKVFGIRNVDHTDYNRSPLGLDQYDQSTGIIVHRITEKWEFTWNGFIGNYLAKDKTQEEQGFSMMYESEPREKLRWAASFLNAQTDTSKKTLMALSYRQGLSKGTSLMAETGLIQNETTTGSITKSTNGSYAYLSSMVFLKQGYNLHTSFERYTQDVDPTTPENWKIDFGLWMFPAMRYEVRFDAVHIRSNSQNSVPDDQWSLLGQLHVYL